MAMPLVLFLPAAEPENKAADADRKRNDQNENDTDDRRRRGGNCQKLYGKNDGGADSCLGRLTKPGYHGGKEAVVSTGYVGVCRCICDAF